MTDVRKHTLRNWSTTVLVVAAVVLVFTWRFQVLSQETTPESIRSVQEKEGIPVETVQVQRNGLSQWITLAGTVEGKVQYPIVSNNALPVVAIEVKEGDRVEKGDVILRLASTAPSPMYHSVEQTRANYENALLNLRRLRNLLEAGAVAQAEVDAAETQAKVLASALQDAEGSTALTASEAGVVSSILVREGDMVQTGHELAWITDTSEVKVVFSAGSHQALRLKEGQTAVWTAPDGSRRNGGVSQLDLMADPDTHLLEGEARFDNSDGLLVPGLLVSFQVLTAESHGALTLPGACVVHHLDQDAVWVVDGTAKLVTVQLGLKTADSVEIVDGLQEGQEVVRHGQALLRMGAMVKIVDAEDQIPAEEARP